MPPTARAACAPPRAAVTVVVLTWNGTEDTRACLETVCPQLGDQDRLVVVDNGSDDDVERQLRTVDTRFHFVQNGRNLGFAGGNNAGLTHALEAGTPWILVLNNDTLLDADTLERLVAEADALHRARPEVAVVQPLLVRADAPSTIDTCGQQLARCPGARDLGAGEPVAALPLGPSPIFGACGAATLVRREALLAVGLYDTDLFVLFEDTDLALRLRAGGYAAVLLPHVRVRHKRGVSRGRGRASARRRAFWVQRNTIALGLRWWPAPALVLGAPVLAWRAAQALWLQVCHGFGPCASLWWRSLRMRGRCRRQLAAAGGDAWFGHEPAWRHGIAPLPGPGSGAPGASALRTAIVVLSWNAADEVLGCLDALADCRGDGVGVVLVDNGSADGTELRVRAQHPWVEVLQTGANLGFAGGNNVGLRWALARGARHVLLLNADARIDRSTLARLTDHLDHSPRVAAVQPLLVRLDGVTVDSAGHRLTARGSALETGAGTPATALEPTPRPIFGACAAAVLLRGAALREVGLLDAGLFVLFEDVDLMFRLRGSGWDVHLLPSARVRHRRGISGQRARWPRDVAGWRRQFWLWRNHTALALRYVPARRLVLGLPRLLARALGALLLAAVLREHALPLWRRFARLRRDSRRALRVHGADRFLGADDGAL